MPGRKRRRSSSSAGSDTTQVHWRQETSVVRTVPAGTPENDWPIFELVDTTVYKQDTTTIANALDVLLDGPFVIRGTLVIDADDQKGHLIMKVKESMPIEIPKCTRYSVGEAEGPPGVDPRRTSLDPVLWLCGRGAWYEIRPSAAYLAHFREICDTIRLYYSIFDYYDNPKTYKNRASKSADDLEKLSDIFFRYVLKVGNGLTRDEVVEKCNKEATFLISQFIIGEVGMKWKWENTFVCKWIKDNHKELWAKATQTLAAPDQAAQHAPLPLLSSRASRNDSKTRSESVTSRGQPSNEQRSRSSRSSTTVIDLTGQPAADSGSSKISKPSAARPLRPKSEAQAPALAQTQAPVPIPIPAPAPTPQQQQSPAISSIEMPNDASNGDSKTAFESVLRGLQKAIEEVSRSKAGLTKVAVSNKIYANYSVPNYRNGHGSHRVPVEEILHYNAPALLKHLDASKWGENDFFPWLQEMSETTFNPIATSKSKFPFKLVPRASRQTDSKATATSTIRTSAVGSRATDQSADDDSDDVIVTPRRRGKGVKTPGRLGKSNLRPVASSKKRLHSEIDDDSDSDSPIAKKSLYFSDGDEVMDDTNDDGILKEEDSDDQKVEIIIRADRIPSTIPKGPDNTWTCDQDDCHYIVRGNDAEECQERIEQHFEEHEERSERLRLAMSESQGHRINHLLDKIKGLGETLQEQDERFIGDVKVPRPIQRKLIV